MLCMVLLALASDISTMEKNENLPRMVLLQLLILVVSSQDTLPHNHPHQCIHDKVSEKPLKIALNTYSDPPLQTREKRNADTEEYQPIRITTTLIPENLDLPSVTGENGSLTQAIEFISQALSVRPAIAPILFTPLCIDETNNSTLLCEEGDNCTCTNITTLRCGPYATVPDQHIGLRNVCSADGNCSLQGPNGTGISDTDFVLYVTATDQGCEGNFEEPGFGQLTSFDTFRNNHFDSFCLIDPGQKNRPVAGWINICPVAPRRQPPETGPFPSVVNRKDSIVRQLVHMLGFSQSLFPFFDVKGGPVVGSEIHDSGLLPAIVTPKVVEVAREHFGCPYINGLYIYGSHWETRLLQPEVMANRLYPLHSYLSQFTLALLEDSGWYKANYSVSERTIGGEYMPFLYGKNLGCSFFYDRCGGFRSNPYQCRLDGCTYDGKYKGQCLVVEENSFCVLAYPTTSCTVSPEKNVQPEGNFPGGIPPFPGNFGGFDLEVFGNNSLCFLSSLVTQTGNVTDFSPTVPRCYGIQPASDGMRYGYSLITAKNNGTASLDLSCKNSGEIVMANDGSIAAGVLYCAHNEAVEFLFPPESVGSEFQAPLCDRTCSSCTKIDDPTACLDCSVPNVFPDSAPPSTCSRARSSTLVNGTLSDDGNFFSGRIQVQFDGMLDDDTTFCVDTVNQTLAEISCLTVEYATVENAFLGQGGVFGEGRGEIYDRFECGFSDEDRFKSFTLVQCPVMNKTNTCDHSMDAGLACSGRQLNKNELIGYPFTTLNGYKEITGCRDCPFSSGQSQFRIRSRPFPNCTEDCPQMVATPYPMKLFDDKDNYTYIRVGTYGGLHFLPYILPNNSEGSPFVEFTPYAELFDTVYQGSVFYKSIQREEDPLLFNRIDGVIADSSITPPSFSFFSTYAFIATWTNVTICCTPKEEINTFQAIVASNGEFTFGIATYPRDGLQSIQRNLFPGVAIYGTQEFLYSFGFLSIGFNQLPVNTENYGQVVLRIDSRDPIPVDTDQDGVDDIMDPCIGCCVSDFSLGVQWPQTVQGGTARMSCSILDSSFTPGSVFTRTCFFNSLWSSVDLTSCTFSAGAANPILTHSVTGFFSLPNVTIDVFINEYSRALESAGITNATVTSLGGLQAATEATYSSILTVEFLLETFDEDLVVTFIQSLDPRRKKRVVESIFQTIDAFGFVPSTMCTCTNVTSSEVFTSVCSGAPQNPCQCTTLSCQCVDPFVPLQETDSSSLQCSLDSEGDTIADPEDNCPDVYSIDNTCPSAQSLTGESCPEEFDEEWGFMWNQTAANTIAGQRCQLLLDGPIVSGSVTRTCSPTGVWQMVNTTQCQSQVITDVRDEILRITNLGRPLTVFEQQEVQMLSQQLDNATSESVLFPADLQSVNVYLDSVSELFENGNVLPDRGVNITTLLAISSNVLDNRFQQGWTTLNDETRPNGASQLLLNVERIASIAANAVTQAPGLPSTQAMQLDNIILDVRLVDTRAASTDVTVGNSQASGSNLTEEELPIITIPSEVLVPIGPSPMVPVTTVVFRNLDTFLPRQLNGGMEFSTTSTQPGTRIISLQVGMFSATIRPVNESITLQFPVIVNNAINPLCVFWSFNDTGSEGWSSSGLSVGSFDESTGTVICISNHSTSFAVLVDVSGRIPPSRALSVLTYIGCGISIICLVLTVIFLISMRKDLYQKVNNFVLLNLCIALICGLIIFCAGIETASWNVIPCTIVAALLHYFFLAAFGWMLCEAVLIYNLLVRVFGAHERKWLYIFLGIGWGFPIPILIISLASRYNYYFIRASLDPSSPLYNDIRACWLSSQEGVIFAFVAPIVAIIIINTCLLIRAMYSLWKSDLGSSAQKISEKDKKASKETAIKLMKATIILMPLLGLTWLIGLLAAIPFPQPVPLILAAFFLILNTLQGAFIFFFHVVRHDRIWPKLRRMCFCIKTKKETTSTGTQSKSNKTTSTVGHSSKSRSLFNSNATQNKYSVNDHSDSIAMDSYVTANIYESEAEKKLDHTGVDAHSVQEFKIEFTDSRFGESIRR